MGLFDWGRKNRQDLLQRVIFGLGAKLGDIHLDWGTSLGNTLEQLAEDIEEYSTPFYAFTEGGSGSAVKAFQYWTAMSTIARHQYIKPVDAEFACARLLYMMVSAEERTSVEDRFLLLVKVRERYPAEYCVFPLEAIAITSSDIRDHVLEDISDAAWSQLESAVAASLQVLYYQTEVIVSERFGDLRSVQDYQSTLDTYREMLAT